MYLSQMREFDIANGPGVRTTIFVSGCTHNCPECFNKEYMNFKNGQPWTHEIEDKIINHLISNDKLIKGLTVLGGEPFQQVRDTQLVDFLKRVKEETGKPIWIFSGYTYEEIITDEARLNILEQCDVLVDGRFEIELKDLMLRFRGSSNQRIIDIQKSLACKQIHELNEYYN